MKYLPELVQDNTFYATVSYYPQDNETITLIGYEEDKVRSWIAQNRLYWPDATIILYKVRLK